MQKLEIGLTAKGDKIWENADRKANVEMKQFNVIYD